MKVKKLVTILLRKRFEVVEDQQGVLRGERLEEEPRPICFRRLRDPRLADQAGNLIEHFQILEDDEAGQLARAFITQITVLCGDEQGAFELGRRRELGRANGKRGLAHTAGAVDEGAPGAIARV